MKTLGFVFQEGETDKYGLTLKLFEIGAKPLEYLDLISIANKEMLFIAEQTGEAWHLGTLDNEIIYLHKIDSSYALRMYSKLVAEIHYTVPLSVKYYYFLTIMMKLEQC